MEMPMPILKDLLYQRAMLIRILRSKLTPTAIQNQTATQVGMARVLPAEQDGPSVERLASSRPLPLSAAATSHFTAGHRAASPPTQVQRPKVRLIQNLKAIRTHRCTRKPTVNRIPRQCLRPTRKEARKVCHILIARVKELRQLADYRVDLPKGSLLD